MNTFIYETQIRCNAQELYEFHADVGNLQLITPPKTRVELLSRDEPISEGSSAMLKITKYGVGFEWSVGFETVQPPHLIVDVARRSPFKFFRHEHHFIDIGENLTLLRDVVTYELPLYPLTLPIEWLVEHDLKKMFAYRHNMTVSLLASED
jgi:ligand-binding SRPBCC domain-containing protein